MTQNLEQSIRRLVTQITKPLPENNFKKNYVAILAEELLKSAKVNYSTEQQQKFIEAASFLEEIGPEKYAQYQAELQANVLRRLVEEGFDQ